MLTSLGLLKKENYFPSPRIKTEEHELELQKPSELLVGNPLLDDESNGHHNGSNKNDDDDNKNDDDNNKNDDDNNKNDDDNNKNDDDNDFKSEETKETFDFLMNNQKKAVRTGTSVLFGKHNLITTSVCISYDNKWIVSASADLTINIWNFNYGNGLENYDEDRIGECVSVLCGHKNPVTSVSISSDNKWIVSGSTDTMLKIWKFDDGKQFLDKNGDQMINCECACTFLDQGAITSISISNDKKWIISSSYQKTIKVWYFDDGKKNDNLDPHKITECKYTLFGHKAWVTSVCISHDNIWILSASEDKTVKIWKLNDGKQQINDQHNKVDSCPCLCTLSGHSNDVTTVSISFDNQWIVSGSADMTVKLWKFEPAQLLVQNNPNDDDNNSNDTCQCVCTLTSHNEPITSASISFGNKWILTAGTDSKVKIWRFDDGKSLVYDNKDDSHNDTCECVCVLNGHDEIVTSATISMNSEWIVSGSWDTTVKVWQFNDGKALLDDVNSDYGICECVSTFIGHTDLVTSISMSKDNKWILSSSGDKTMKLWSFNDGKKIIFDNGSGNSISNNTFDSTYTITGHNDRVGSTSISFDNKWIVSGSSDKTVKVWKFDIDAINHPKNNSKDPFECICTMTAHNDIVTTVAISNGNKWIVSGSWDMTVRVWRFDDGQGVIDANNGSGSCQCVRVFKGHTHIITNVSISNNCKWIFSASWDKTAKVWGFDNGETVLYGYNKNMGNNSSQYVCDLVGHTYYLTCVVLSYDHKWILSSSRDNSVKIWKFNNGQAIIHRDDYMTGNDTCQCVCTLLGHNYYATSTSISRDNKWIVSSSRDNTTKIWRFDDGEALIHDNETGTPTCQCVCTLIGHNNWVTSAIISTDCKWIVSGSEDRTLKVWKWLGTDIISLPPNFIVMSYIADEQKHHDDTFRSWSNIRHYSIQSPTILFEQYKFPLSYDFSKILTKQGVSETIIHHAIRFKHNKLLKILFEQCQNTEGQNKLTDLNQRIMWAFVRCYAPLHQIAEQFYENKTFTKFQNDSSHQLNQISPLGYACAFNNVAAVSIVLKCLEQAWSFIQHDPRKLTDPHPLDFFPTSELALVIRKYSQPGILFMKSVNLVRSYGLVAGKKELWPINDDEMWIRGSNLRCPRGFWQNKTGSDVLVPSTAEKYGLSVRNCFSMIFDFFLRVANTRKIKTNKSVETQEGGLPAIPMLVPIQRCVRQLFEASMTASDITGRSDIYESPVIVAVVQYKWDLFGKQLYLTQFLWYVLFIIFFSILSAFSDNWKISAYPGIRAANWTLQAIKLLLLLYFVFLEFKQMHNRTIPIEKYFSDFWNIIIWALFICVVFGTILQVSSNQLSPLSRYVNAIAAVLVWFYVLFFVRGFKSTGPLVRMVLQITFDVRPFLLVLSIVILGFSNSFLIIFNELDFSGNTYDTPLKSLRSTFVAMLGDFDTSTFDQSQNKVLSSLLFALFMLIVAIVLLNLLIALMGDIFARVQGNSISEWRREQAYILHDLEVIYILDKNDESRQKCDPLWLQILLPSSKYDEEGGEQSNEWKGRVNEIVVQIESNSQKQTEKLNDLIVKQDENLNKKILTVDGKINAIENKFTNMQNKLDSILVLLSKQHEHEQKQQQQQN